MLFLLLRDGEPALRLDVKWTGVGRRGRGDGGPGEESEGFHRIISSSSKILRDRLRTGLNDGVCLRIILGDLLSVGLGERLPLYLESTAASFDELNFSYAFGGNGGVWGEETGELPPLPLEDLTETGTKIVGVLV